MNKQYVIISIIIGFILTITSCTDLKKDLPVATSGEVKIHDAGWEDDTSKTIFHGKYLKEKNWNSNECENCHGTTYMGGTSGISCYRCHPSFPHPDLWDTTFAGFRTSLNFHGTFLRDRGWHLDRCKLCHGSTYSGGSIVLASCSDSLCHTTTDGVPKSPEACNTCHGKFRAVANDTLSWAPPSALSGDTLETSPGVGAHQAHLSEGSISNLIKCYQCHIVPATVTEAGHIDNAMPAEVAFDTSLAALLSANRTFNPDPNFDYNALKCNNTFCHGNWRVRKATSSYAFVFTDTLMTGAAYAPIWTGGGTEATCGTCHGLPPTGHTSATLATCGGCHSGIVNSSGVIVNNTKHLNGKINVFNIELSF